MTSLYLYARFQVESFFSEEASSLNGEGRPGTTNGGPKDGDASRVPRVLEWS